MELIKLGGKRIDDYYDVSKLDKVRETFVRSINVPFHKDIPTRYRGRVIPVADLDSFEGIPFRSKAANPKQALNSRFMPW